MTRLTEEMVIARSKQSDLSNIKKLNCWGSDLSDVSIIKRMRGVEVLALSVNKINSLQYFEDCPKLQELYLRKNNIQDLSELVYLQNLPHLKNLWLEENPCVDSAGSSYRQTVLRALPNLKKLDNVDVTPEEVSEAIRSPLQRMEESFEETSSYSNDRGDQNNTNHHQPSQHQQYRNQSPNNQQSPENTESECISDPIVDRNSVPSSPMQRSPPIQERYSPPIEPNNHPPSPRFQREHRLHYNPYDRSPGSDQDSPMTGHRDRVPIAPSMSSHSMKEYYQSEYQKPSPVQYRHSQIDLTEWEDNHQTNHNNHNNSRESVGHNQQPPTRRVGSGGGDRENVYQTYRNGNNSRESNDNWEDNEQNRRTINRRQEGRFSDTASVVSNAVLNHYASYHRRPVNRNSNLLSATLCLVKELDYPSLEVVEHAVRCRIDELSAE